MQEPPSFLWDRSGSNGAGQICAVGNGMLPTARRANLLGAGQSLSHGQLASARALPAHRLGSLSHENSCHVA
eukprot:6192930-Pleurochrysis_carterae.AAC.4